MGYNGIEVIRSATVFDKVELQRGSYYVIGVELDSGYQYDVAILCDIIEKRSPVMHEPIYKAVELYNETMRRINE